MNGRRARHIRWYADEACREQGVQDFGDKTRPREIRNRAGNVVHRYPEVRLMPGPRYLARRIRRIYTRTGRYPVVVEQ